MSKFGSFAYLCVISNITWLDFIRACYFNYVLMSWIVKFIINVETKIPGALSFATMENKIFFYWAFCSQLSFYLDKISYSGYQSIPLQNSLSITILCNPEGAFWSLIYRYWSQFWFEYCWLKCVVIFVTAEVWEWISNFISNFTRHVITYPRWH